MSASGSAAPKSNRRARDHAANRAAILAAARRVAEREGARDLSLRGVAAEAGYSAPALYGYFRDKDELLLALAADDLGQLSKAMREAGGAPQAGSRFMAALTAALTQLQNCETIAAAQGALPSEPSASEAERHFNGRLIAALTALSDAAGLKVQSRESQADVVLMAASLAGVALLARSGRLSALGFNGEEILRRLDARFNPAP